MNRLVLKANYLVEAQKSKLSRLTCSRGDHDDEREDVTNHVDNDVVVGVGPLNSKEYDYFRMTSGGKEVVLLLVGP